MIPGHIRKILGDSPYIAPPVPNNIRTEYSSVWLTSGLATPFVHPVIQKWTPKIGALAVQQYAIPLAQKFVQQDIHLPGPIPARTFCVELLVALDRLHARGNWQPNAIWRLNMFVGGSANASARHLQELTDWNTFIAELNAPGLTVEILKAHISRWKKNEQWFLDEVAAIRK